MWFIEMTLVPESRINDEISYRSRNKKKETSKSFVSNFTEFQRLSNNSPLSLKKIVHRNYSFAKKKTNFKFLSFFLADHKINSSRNNPPWRLVFLICGNFCFHLHLFGAIQLQFIRNSKRVSKLSICKSLLYFLV